MKQSLLLLIFLIIGCSSNKNDEYVYVTGNRLIICSNLVYRAYCGLNLTDCMDIFNTKIPAIECATDVLKVKKGEYIK